MRFPSPLHWLLIGFAATSAIAVARDANTAVNPTMDTLCYVGTYTTGGKSQGIYAFRWKPSGAGTGDTAQLEPLGLAAETANPSFLEIDVRRRLVFAVNELSSFGGEKSGAVSAFAIEPGSAKLRFINQVASGGTDPCHVVLDRTGKTLFVANYSSGSVAVIPVATDGRLGTPHLIQHHGHSVDPQRQKGPHAHCTTLDPANRFAFVCDLGLDQIVAYRFDAAHGTLTADANATVPTKPGAGPRHLVFRPDGRFAYLVNELNSTVTAYAYDPAHGKLTELQAATTLPPRFTGKSSGAEIAVHPSGRQLYISNRGRDNIAVFDIDAQSGRLTYATEVSTGGKTPRHFALAPGARQLVAENQGSDSLRLFRIDDRDGALTPFGSPLACPAPVCVVFVPPAAN